MKKLNFGCGRDIKLDYINADIVKFDGVDIAFDFNSFPYPFNDNEFDEVYCDNVLEHLEDVKAVIDELYRISKNNCIIHIIVPYYNCYGAYNDVTHKHYFSHMSFEPFYNENYKYYYYFDKKFKLENIKLTPTRIGKVFLFKKIILFLSFIFGQIIQNIDVKLKVIK